MSENYEKIKSKSVFISCIGSNDPWGGREVVRSDEKDDTGPFMRAWGHVRSAYAIIFSTPQPDEKPDDAISQGTCFTVELLEEEGVKVFVHTRSLDPTNYQELFEFIRPGLVESLAELPEVEKIYIGVSSGTPQQQSVWMSLVSSGQIDATMLQSLDPERVPPGASFVREVHTDFIVGDMLVNAAISHLKNGEFHSAMENARRASDNALDTTRRDRISAASDVLKVLHLTRLSKYKKARKAFNELKKNFESFAPESWMNSASATLKTLADLDSGRTGASKDGLPALKKRLLELFSQIEYKLKTEDFMQVVILSFTLFESWLNIRAIELYERPINDSRYWKKQSPKTTGEEKTTGREFILENDEECIKLKDHKYQWILSNGKTKGQITIEDAFYKSRDKSVRKVRNNAIHCGYSVSENDALKAFEGARVFVNQVFSADEIDSYFTRPSHLEWLVNLIKAGIHVR